MNAPPVTTTLSDGNEYTLAPIGLHHIMQFKVWLNHQEGKKPQTIRPISEVMEGVETLDGLVYVLWLSLKENHPEVKRDEVPKLVGSLGNLSLLVDGLIDLPEGDDEDPPKDKGEGD